MSDELTRAADELVRYYDPVAGRLDFPAPAFWTVIDHARRTERDRQRLREYLQAELEAAKVVDSMISCDAAVWLVGYAVDNFFELHAGQS